MAKNKKREPATGATPAATEFAKIQYLAEFMNRHSLAEVEWETAGERIRLKSRAGAAHEAAPLAPQFLSAPARTPERKPDPVAATPAVETKAASAAAQSAKTKTITSPFVGTFYRAASPESEPFVREGQIIKRGQVLCIIEAMKLMNEIESELAGKVVSILVENAQPVEFGEPLFTVEVG